MPNQLSEQTVREIATDAAHDVVENLATVLEQQTEKLLKALAAIERAVRNIPAS